MDDLKLIILSNMEEFDENVDKYLMLMNDRESYRLPIKEDRFNNGEAKIRIDATIRDKGIYILSDIGNYGITYKMHGMNVPMSPDEHLC